MASHILSNAIRIFDTSSKITAQEFTTLFNSNVEISHSKDTLEVVFPLVKEGERINLVCDIKTSFNLIDKVALNLEPLLGLKSILRELEREIGNKAEVSYSLKSSFKGNTGIEEIVEEIGDIKGHIEEITKFLNSRYLQKPVI